MKLPETLLFAVGCAALVGCGTSEAGGRAAIPETPTEVVIPEVSEVAVPEVAAPERSTIPEIGGHPTTVSPGRNEVLAPTGGGTIGQHDIGRGWDDCPGCGMG